MLGCILRSAESRAGNKMVPVRTAETSAAMVGGRRRGITPLPSQASLRLSGLDLGYSD